MKYIFFLFVPILFLCLSCNKEINSNKDQFSKSDFPINVGNWWRYQVTDANSHTIDTLLLKVISKENIINDIKYNCEIYNNNILIDTGYYLVSDKIISYKGKNSDYSYLADFYLNIPFKKGDNWQGEHFAQDTVTVSDKIASVKILGNEYSNVFTLNRNFYAIGGYRYNQLIFISQNIGIIYQTIDIQNSGLVQKQGFQLIDYEFK